MSTGRLSLSPDGWVIGVTHHDTPNQPLGGGMVVPAGVSGVVMHTMVGNLPGTDAEFMKPGTQKSAHFGIAQDGTVIQWVNVRGGVAWHCFDPPGGGNYNWYGIEHADDGDPLIPLTAAQMYSSAQLVELLSRDDVGRFPLAEANTTSQLGYGVHYMGGAAWGGHSCPQAAGGVGPRAGQRAAILSIAKTIRSGTPKTVGEAEDTMQVTFGTDDQAGIPMPNNVTHLRLSCSQGAVISVTWAGGTTPTRDYTLSFNQRADVPIPPDQKGQVVLTAKSAAGPVGAVWLTPQA